MKVNYVSIIISIALLSIIGLAIYLIYKLVSESTNDKAKNVKLPPAMSTYDPATASKAYVLLNSNNNAIQSMKSNTPVVSNGPSDFGDNSTILANMMAQTSATF